MRAIRIKDTNIDFEKLDNVIKKLVPSGNNIHEKPLKEAYDYAFNSKSLTFALSQEQKNKVLRSLGTLGGGNHYIELGKSENGEIWLTVHTGSRGLGVIVANHHQKIAESLIEDKSKVNQAIVEYLKNSNRAQEIQNALKLYKDTNVIPEYVNIEDRGVVNKDYAYLDGVELHNYLHDLRVAQEYSMVSRHLILSRIAKAMNWTVIDEFESMHNYVDIDNGIIRKGATSAQKGERLIIPLNMRDGSIFATGKGNKDWNYSAPHGAGRVLSRSQAKEILSLEEYKDTMKDIYTTSVSESTLDEAPFAYKPADEIINAITDTVEINAIVKPIYNFKAH